MLSKTITDKLDKLTQEQLKNQRIMALDYEDKDFQDEVIKYIDYKLGIRDKHTELLREIEAGMPDIDDIN